MSEHTSAIQRDGVLGASGDGHRALQKLRELSGVMSALLDEEQNQLDEITRLKGQMFSMEQDRDRQLKAFWTEKEEAEASKQLEIKKLEEDKKAELENEKRIIEMAYEKNLERMTADFELQLTDEKEKTARATEINIQAGLQCEQVQRKKREAEEARDALKWELERQKNESGEREQALLQKMDDLKSVMGAQERIADQKKAQLNEQIQGLKSSLDEQQSQATQREAQLLTKIESLEQTVDEYAIKNKVEIARNAKEIMEDMALLKQALQHFEEKFYDNDGTARQPVLEKQPVLQPVLEVQPPVSCEAVPREIEVQDIAGDDDKALTNVAALSELDKLIELLELQEKRIRIMKSGGIA